MKNDRIEPIIAETDFFKVQDMFKSKLQIYNEKQIGKHAPYSRFGGHLICGECGAMYTHNVDKGRGFYNCANKKQHGLKVCNNVNVQEKELDEFFDEQFIHSTEDMQTTKEVCLERLYYRASKIIDKIQNGNNDEVEQLKNKVAELNKNINKLIDLYTTMENVEALKIRIKQTQNELDHTKAKLKEALNPLEKGNSQLSNIKRLIDKVNDAKEVFENEDEYLDTVDIVVFSYGEKLTIKNRFEDEILKISAQGYDLDGLIDEQSFYDLQTDFISDDYNIHIDEKDGHTLKEAKDKFENYMFALEKKETA